MSTRTAPSLPRRAPSSSPTKSMGALSRSPSPMTTRPSIWMPSISRRIASTATWSEYLRWPKPMVLAAAMAACSVTRMKSCSRR